MGSCLYVFGFLDDFSQVVTRPNEHGNNEVKADGSRRPVRLWLTRIAGFLSAAR
jgi:hypothetical protein